METKKRVAEVEVVDDEIDNINENENDNIKKVVKESVKTSALKKQKKNQTDEKGLDADFLKKESYEESDLVNLNAKLLKEVLAAHGLGTSGKKDELKDRVLNQIPLPIYEALEKSYEWDSTEQASKRKYYLSRAKTSQANCVRCLTKIDQNRPIISKDSWDNHKNHKISRKYHVECFFKYPPTGTDSFSDLKWELQNDATLIPLASKLFDQYHSGNEPFLKPRETPIENEGMRAQCEILKAEFGLTGKQAIEAMKNIN